MPVSRADMRKGTPTAKALQLVRPPAPRVPAPTLGAPAWIRPPTQKRPDVNRSCVGDSPPGLRASPCDHGAATMQPETTRALELDTPALRQAMSRPSTHLGTRGVPPPGNARIGRRSLTLAHALAVQGIGHGDRVGLVLPNSPEFVPQALGPQEAMAWQGTGERLAARRLASPGLINRWWCSRGGPRVLRRRRSADPIAARCVEPRCARTSSASWPAPTPHGASRPSRAIVDSIAQPVRAGIRPLELGGLSGYTRGGPDPGPWRSCLRTMNRATSSSATPSAVLNPPSISINGTEAQAMKTLP